MASERSEFIQRTAERCLPTIIRLNSEATAQSRCGPVEPRVTVDETVMYANLLADALNLTDSPAPAGGETYEIPAVIADKWADDIEPENEGYGLGRHQALFNAIAAARKPGGEA